MRAVVLTYSVILNTEYQPLLSDQKRINHRSFAVLSEARHIRSGWQCSLEIPIYTERPERA